MAAPKTLPSKEKRTERARKGAQAINSVDGLIKRIVAKAPELTDDQKRQLAAVLGGGR